MLEMQVGAVATALATAAATGNSNAAAKAVAQAVSKGAPATAVAKALAVVGRLTWVPLLNIIDVSERHELKLHSIACCATCLYQSA
jgi:hypothetical protein